MDTVFMGCRHVFEPLSIVARSVTAHESNGMCGQGQMGGGLSI